MAISSQKNSLSTKNKKQKKKKKLEASIRNFLLYKLQTIYCQ